MKVEEVRADGQLTTVELIDGTEPVEIACRFLQFLSDRNFSPNTWRAYAYDLRYLFMFLKTRDLPRQAFTAPLALDFLSYMRREPSKKAAQRLGLTVIVGGEDGGRLLSPATVHRVLAGVSSFYDWAIAMGAYAGESPLEKCEDLALARVPDRHQPFTGGASRQRPMRRAVTVKRPLRLPRPLDESLVSDLLESVTSLRDLAILLLMLDGGLRPGEVLSLHLEDISFGHRRVVVRKRDDHPRGARPKSRSERVVDLHDPRTLDAVSHYVMHERRVEATSPFVFLVGGKRKNSCDPLSYDAVVRMFARKMQKLGRRTPDTTPHALRHTHATAMWEGGMRELTLQKRIGHASPNQPGSIHGSRTRRCSRSTRRLWGTADGRCGLGAHPARTSGASRAQPTRREYQRWIDHVLRDATPAARRSRLTIYDAFVERWPLLDDWFAEPLNVRLDIHEGVRPRRRRRHIRTVDQGPQLGPAIRRQFHPPSQHNDRQVKATGSRDARAVRTEGVDRSPAE